MLVHHNSHPRDPSRIVVVGAGGFVGRALGRALADTGIPRLDLVRPEYDLASPDATERVAATLRADDAVVMLAAVTPDKGRGFGAFAANLQMGQALCQAVGAVGVSHLVYVSSDAVYPMAEGLISEATAAAPTDLYGAMHLSRELMSGIATKAPVAILRPTLLYGFEDTHNSYGPNRLRRAAHKDGKITLFGNGEEMRDHVSVDDVAALIVKVLRYRSAGILNVATGRSISYKELAKKVAALFDRGIEITGSPRQNPITHRHFDVTAALTSFPGFRFTPLEDGLARAHKEMLEQANG